MRAKTLPSKLLGGRRRRAGSALEDLSLIAWRLKNSSPQLYSRLVRIYQVAAEDYYPRQTLPGFTSHGLEHIRQVLRNADSLLGYDGDEVADEVVLRDGESFLLSSAILLHDVGQIDVDPEVPHVLDTYDHHGEKSAEIIRDAAEKLGLNAHESELIADLARSHRMPTYREIVPSDWSISPLGSCRPRLIAALLRIADLLDISHARAPASVLRSIHLPSTSVQHWDRHAAISDVRIDQSCWSVTVFAKPRSTKQWDALNAFGSWLQDELTAVQEDFRSVGLHYRVIELNSDRSRFQRPFTRNSSNPYQGLSPFSAATAHVFFGRDEEAAEILRLLKTRRFLSLVGESGVGKTSLVQAGVLPILEYEENATVEYRFRSPVPNTLLESLARALKVPQETGIVGISKRALGLARARRNIVVYIDQFEELFTLSFPKEEKEGFCALVRELLSTIVNLKILISVRSDFLIDLWELRKIDPVFFSHDDLMRLAKLGRAEARQAIEKPLYQYTNLAWEDDLVHDLIKELTDQGPGVYPPYLQLVCHALVTEKLKELNRLEPQELRGQFLIGSDLYEGMGKAEEIINRHFQSILDRFGPEEREVIDKILSLMITEYSSRRPVRLEEIDKVNAKGIDAKRAMQRLVDARVVKRVYLGYELEHDLLARKLVSILRSTARASTVIERTIDYMRKHLRQAVSLHDLVTVARLSRAQLSRRFRQETGSTPLTHLVKLRIEEARGLLRDTGDPINVIARQCGFASPVHFVNMFKRWNGGVTPRAYRRIAIEAYAKEFEA